MCSVFLQTSHQKVQRGGWFMNFACAITSHFATLHIKCLMWSSTLRVEIQRVAEALNESNGAAASLTVRGGNARPAAVRGKDGTYEALQYVSVAIN
jgi:hypothetical protein